MRLSIVPCALFALVACTEVPPGARSPTPATPTASAASSGTSEGQAPGPNASTVAPAPDAAGDGWIAAPGARFAAASAPATRVEIDSWPEDRQGVCGMGGCGHEIVVHGFAGNKPVYTEGSETSRDGCFTLGTREAKFKDWTGIEIAPLADESRSPGCYLATSEPNNQVRHWAIVRVRLRAR